MSDSWWPWIVRVSDSWWPSIKAMSDSWWPWIVRVLWLSLPFVAGPAFGDALAGSSRGVQVVATLGLWALWALGMALSVVPHTVTLTPFRILVPGAFAGVVWATLADGASGWSVGALAVTATASLVVLSPQMGAWFVNGSSYGDERRVPLRAPGQLLIGPVPLAWATVVTGVVAGPLLLAAEQWVLGAIVSVVGFGGAWVAGRSLHALARRWLVFVPAGLVVHDHLALDDPVLFKRSAIAAFGPALADTTAKDLTFGALGLALELQTRQPVEIAYRTRLGSAAEVGEVDAVIIAVSSPGAVLAEAGRRRILVG